LSPDPPFCIPASRMGFL